MIFAREDLPILLETGREIRHLLPRAVFMVIEDAGHVPHYERVGVVNPLLVEFLRG